MIKIDLFSCFFKQKYANTNFYNKIRILLKIFTIFSCGRLAAVAGLTTPAVAFSS